MLELCGVINEYSIFRTLDDIIKADMKKVQAKHTATEDIPKNELKKELKILLAIQKAVKAGDTGKADKLIDTLDISVQDILFSNVIDYL